MAIRKAEAALSSRPNKARKTSATSTPAAKVTKKSAATTTIKKPVPETRDESSDEEEEEEEEQSHDDSNGSEDSDNGSDEEEESEEEEEEEEEDTSLKTSQTKKDNKRKQDDASTKAKKNGKKGGKEKEEDDKEEEVQAEEEAEEQLAETFKELGLVDVLCEICEKLGYAKPSPIQAKSIPKVLDQRDMIGTAETGSGKTLAFALPIMQALLETPQPYFALILSPTRELAVQICDQFRAFNEIGIRCCTLIGGENIMPQKIALAKKPHVIVATPGRILDHLQKTKGFSLRRLKFLVLDEADRMLDMDFGVIMQKIFEFLPRERRTMLFSATMSSKVESLQRAALRDPVRVAIQSDQQTVSTLIQNVVPTFVTEREANLVYLLEVHRDRTVVVFVRTIVDTQRLATMLRMLGFGAVPLHGKMDQSSRLAAVNKIQSGDRHILVATDVAARGLHMDRVGIVINYEIPTDAKTYVHRVGRTARAGKAGRAISLVTELDFPVFLGIEKAIGLEKQIKPYPMDKEAVAAIKPQVEEAVRLSRNELREQQKKYEQRKRGRHGGGRGSAFGKFDDMDKEEV